GYFEGVFLNAEKYAALNQKLQEIGERYGVGKDTIAYAWILRLPFDMQVVLGTSKPARLINGAKAADIRLTRTEWYDIYKAAGNMLP
ncbi:MAG: aldo/keto reductase, partial [Erysipelotrichaceae bacterium]|nr:aldo/keto reductase [Erysipelotrichaceae bacterium]